MLLSRLVLWGNTVYPGIATLDTAIEVNVRLVDLLAQGQELHPGLVTQRSVLLEVLSLDRLPDVVGFSLAPQDDLCMNLPSSGHEDTARDTLGLLPVQPLR
jgi:hypothetical protein